MECIFSSRRFVGIPSELYLRENRVVLSAAFTKGADDAPQLFNRTASYSQRFGVRIKLMPRGVTST